ncbi:MAG: DEAD/DEAH box helicase [Ardenticatenales bacterium]|nr:DEAD/DEAH box helicase [Ardenticatenales bacterium]
MTTFAELGLAEPVLRALAERDYTTPTPIQIDALPVALAKRDLIACAQTGSGKTAVFALPWLHHRHNDLQRNGGASGRQPEALVLVPTRELAIQVADAFAAYGKHVRFRVTAVYGGVGYGPQTTALTRGVDVLVATPGRLIDHLERGNVRLDGVKYLVLDEADRMLDLGFLPQVRRVLEDGRVPKAGRQTLLFSATMPPQIAALAKDYLHNPERVEVDAPNTAVDRIEQRLYPVAQDQKPELLARLLRDEEVEAAIVFCRTRRRADKLSKALSQAGLTNAAIHSDVAQNKREQILDAFRSGKLRLMIATDVASRGLDIPHLSHVINLDVPTMAEDYVHRIGRTGRAGRDGIAMTLYSHTDEALWQAVEALTGLKLAPITVPDFDYMIDDSEPLLTRRQQADRNRVARAAGQGVPRARGERSRQPAGRAPAASVNGRSTSPSATPARAAAPAGQTQPSRAGGRADGPARSGDGRRVDSGGRTDAGGRGRDGRRTDNGVRGGDARRSDTGVRGGDGRRPDAAPRTGNGNGVSRREPAAAFGGRPAPRQDDRRSNEPRRDDRRPAEPRRAAPAEVGSRPVPPDRQARGVVNIGIEPRRRMTPEERAALLASDGPTRRDDDR